MTDIPKVITTLVPVRTNSEDWTSNSRTYSKSPESDRPVFVNTNGFLETHLPCIRGGFQLVNNSNDVSGTLRNTSLMAALTGDYLNSADVTLDPSLIGPQITYLICWQYIGNRTWTFPTVTNLCKYLRTTYPDLYRPGLFWTINFVNNTETRTLTLDIPDAVNPQSVRRWGMAGATTRTLPTNSSLKVSFLVEGTTPGSEKLSYFVTK